MDRTQERAQRARAPEKGLEKSASARKVVEHLNRLAASNLVFYYKAKAAHWTVRGPLFYQIHKLLDKVAGAAFEAIDPLAERVRQLDGVPPLGLEAALDMSAVKDRPKDVVANRAMLEDLRADSDRISALYREAADATGDEDPGSNDLVTGLLQKHDMVAWFLRQTLVKEGDAEI
jgi:starvation-inducible DNA-binding protein